MPSASPSPTNPSLTNPSPTRDSKPPPSIGAQITELGQRLNVSQHRLVRLAAEFEADDEWIRAGAPTAAHWIADRLDIAVSTAREWIRIGKLLRRLPGTNAAFASNAISFSKVRSLSRLATPTNERELLQLATTVPAGRLGGALADWSKRNEHPTVRDARHRRERHLAVRVEPDGMISGSFRLTPQAGGALMAAIDATCLRQRQAPRRATEPVMQSGDGASADAWPSRGQQRADALVELVCGGGAKVATELIVHVRGDGCTLDDGTPISDTVVEELAPTSFLRVLVHDAHGRPINASARRRHPTTRQKRVVHERDRRCVDCGSHDLLEYDHVPDFELTGHTVIEELVLRCANCHHRRHGCADSPAST